MQDNRIRIMAVAAVGFIGHGFAQQVDVVYVGRGQTLHQVSADELIPPEDELVGWPNFSFSAGAEFGSGNITEVEVDGPGFSNPIPIPMFEGNPLEYELDYGLSSRAELDALAPAGTYFIRGRTWPPGSFSEPIELGAYEPVSPKRLLNYDQLQEVDPRGYLTVEWEPFSDLNGRDGFLEVEVGFWDGQEYRIAWSSDGDDDDDGLPVDATGVMIPPWTLTMSPDNVYELSLWFGRIESIGETQNFDTGMKGTVSWYEIVAEITTLDPFSRPGQIHLFTDGWATFPPCGYAYGSHPENGYAVNMGWINVLYTPQYLYQYNVGWLIPVEGNMDDGIWFYSPVEGWLYTESGWNGECRKPGGGWLNLSGPGL